MEDKSFQLRGHLVDALTANGSISGDPVREAFQTVPRERFVPMIHAVRGLDSVYADTALITKEHSGIATSSSSQPSIMAQMLEASELRAGMRVLEIGLGSGYNAALLSTIIGRNGQVTSIDNDDNLVALADERLTRAGYLVNAICGDGRNGWMADAPYDRIIVTASTDVCPRTWWEQLVPGGMLVTPLRIGAMQLIAALTRTETGFRSTTIIPGGFMPLRDDDVDRNPVATLKLTIAVPGQSEVNVTLQGPGLAHLTVAAVKKLPGLLLDKPEIQAIPLTPAWPLIWNLVLNANPANQISLYADRPQIQVGLLDAESGSCALLCAKRHGTDWLVDAIEGYGVHDTLTSELKSFVDDVRANPERSLDDISITVVYNREAAVPDAAVHIINATDHDIHIGWDNVPG